MEKEEAKPEFKPSDKNRAREARKPQELSNDKLAISTPVTPSPQDWLSHVQACYAFGAARNPFFSSKPPVYPTYHPTLWGNPESLQKQYGMAAFQYTGFYHPAGFHGYPVGVTTTPLKDEGNFGNESFVEIMEERKRILDGAETLHDGSGKSERKASSYRISGEDAEPRTTKETESPVEVSDVRNHKVTETARNTSTATLVDEDEKKRERRKQSNRESARRSRIRKQEELERLRVQRKQLSVECSEIKHTILSLSEKCETLAEENKSILEELERLYGPKSVAELRAIHDELVNGETSNNPNPIMISEESSNPKPE